MPRSITLSIALLALVSTPTAARSQCESAPRIVLPDQVCTLGQPCDVSLLLEAGGQSVASVAARLGSSATFTCQQPCEAGAAAPEGSCSLNASTCKFNVFDLSPPITAFGEGTVAVIELTCHSAGANAFSLSEVSFGGVNGLPVSSCGAGGIITCDDVCAAVDCDDDNPCTTDTCDPSDGSCDNVAAGDGTQCDDGLFCNGADTCAGGTCSSHAGDPCADGGQCAETCDESTDSCDAPSGTPCTLDGNPCTDDVCNGGGDCIAVSNSAACNDGVFCNGADTCIGGACDAHAGNPCAAGGECADSCNEAADTCSIAAGTPCEDDENPCTDDQCDGNGDCVGVANSEACDDGSFCNGADTCAGGACASHGGDPCVGGAECTDVCNESADACLSPAGSVCTDDGNPCTDNQCNGAGACVAIVNAATCSDGLFCNGPDTCSGGTCSLHAGDPCAGAGECADTCDETADSCDDTAGVACSDDGNPCTDNQCDGNGDCVGVPSSDACDDGLFCNGPDTCSDGTCSLHAGDPCVGGSECADACNETADSCNDTAGVACTDDGNLCTDNRCNGSGGCAAVPNSAPCDDGRFCTAVDECLDGTCVGSGDPCEGQGCSEDLDACTDCETNADCSAASNACNDAVCNPESGNCSRIPKPDDSTCSDGKFCTDVDACLNGVCVGAGDPCTNGPECAALCDEVANTCDEPAASPCTDDLDACTDDVCDGAGECIHPAHTGNCDDGSFCTVDDSCATGVCAGSIRDCDDQISCTADACDEIGDTCTHLPSDAACNDGVFCNGSEVCDLAEGCAAPSAPDCSDLDDECSVGTCDEESFACISLAVDDGTSCEDWNLCTSDDSCTLGECTGVSYCGTPLTRGRAPKASDALFVLRDAVGLEACDPCECDVNSDGAGTTTDALLVLRKVVDLEAELTCFLPGSNSSPTTTTEPPAGASTTSSTLAPTTTVDLP